MREKKPNLHKSDKKHNTTTNYILCTDMNPVDVSRMNPTND